MIALEIILPTANKRLCMTVAETTKIGELKKYLRDFFEIKNGRILMLSAGDDVPDEMSLAEAGLYTGSGVVIEDG